MKDINFAYQIQNFLNAKEIQHNYPCKQNKRLCENRQTATRVKKTDKATCNVPFHALVQNILLPQRNTETQHTNPLLTIF